MSASSLAMAQAGLPLVPRLLLAHALALLAAGLGVRLLAGAGFEPGFAHLAGLEGLVAFGFSRWLRLPIWWQVINLCFLPAVWLAAQVELASGWYLAGLLLLVLTSLGALTTRVPLYLSSDQAVAEVALRIPEGDGRRVIDLGCGLGGFLAGLAAKRPDVAFYGIEAAPLSWLASHLRLSARARIRLGSLWQEDLSGYDVVYAYLSPEPMPRLWQKAMSEMRPGSRFISNTFPVPDAVPDEIIELNDLSQARLLVWRMP